MPTGKIQDENGAVVGELELPRELFDVPFNGPVVHQVVTAAAAARRAGTHSTLTRAEVRGGGAKPYRQKGTGWARQGTIRAAQMRGGGVAFGPKPRNYEQRTPRKMRRVALRQVLSQRFREERCVFLNQVEAASGKTRDLNRLIDTLSLEGEVLFILPEQDELVARSASNLPGIRVARADCLSASLLLSCDFLVMTPESVNRMNEVYGS